MSRPSLSDYIDREIIDCDPRTPRTGVVYGWRRVGSTVSFAVKWDSGRTTWVRQDRINGRSNGYRWEDA